MHPRTGSSSLNTTELRESLARFRYEGGGPEDASPTREEQADCGGLIVPRYTNEFWTSRQRRGHPLHEVSYRACFKAELPRFFIERLTDPGDLVYDPFMGRGTTLLEAGLCGRRMAGNDVNPLSRILLEPRLDPPALDEIVERLRGLDLAGPAPADLDLSMFYSPSTESQIVRLRDYLAERQAQGAEDRVDRWIRMVATNRLTGHSPGFFSVYTLPPNQAVAPEAQRKINERRKQTPPARDVVGLILRKTRSLLRLTSCADREALAAGYEPGRLFCLDAREHTGLPDGSVALVVTSPPFLDIVQYNKDNWLRCWFNGLDAKAIGRSITMARSVEQWSEVMLGTLRELARMLRPGGWVAFEVGEVRRGSVRLDEVIAPLGVEAGLECAAIMVNEQDFTKTAHCWGVANNAGGTNTNRIVLLRKP